MREPRVAVDVRDGAHDRQERLDEPRLLRGEVLRVDRLVEGVVERRDRRARRGAVEEDARRRDDGPQPLEHVVHVRRRVLGVGDARAQEAQRVGEAPVVRRTVGREEHVARSGRDRAAQERDTQPGERLRVPASSMRSQRAQQRGVRERHLVDDVRQCAGPGTRPARRRAACTRHVHEAVDVPRERSDEHGIVRSVSVGEHDGVRGRDQPCGGLSRGGDGQDAR